MNPLRDYRNFSRGGGGGPYPDDESAKAIVAKVLEQRSQGHAITDAQVLAAHPELREQLRRVLGIANQIRQAMLAAGRATTANESLPSLTDSELDAAIAESQNHATGSISVSNEALPHMPGYLLVNEINRGGQAAVYHAIQESTQRKVAIKVMSGGPFASSRHRVRFEREVRILAALDHPNIVSIIERGRTPDGSFYFVMQYIEGGALDVHWTALTDRNPDGLRQLVQLFSKISTAMEEAHSRGIIHRDLKPSNIVVDHRGEPHILDFGLARPVDEAFDVAACTITVPGQIIGSLPWASPEQAAGQSGELEAVSDVYSIGVMLFQALTGDFPYSLQGPIDEVLLRIRTLKAGPPSKQPKVRPGVDASLDAIVLKALAKSPKDRYRSAGSMAADLENWLNGKPTQAVRRVPHLRFVTLAAISMSCVLIAPVAWYAAQRTNPAVFTLPSMENSIGMKFVEIPPGNFMMGSPRTEGGRNPNESQSRVVIDHAFYMATTTVTQEQFARVMHENPSDPKWLGPNMPVQNVTWAKAIDFCQRLSAIDHAHYRLPTEVEWEYACLAKCPGPFPNPIHPELSIFSLENSGGAIHSIAQKFPNAWGLYDMQGNVYQWCSDIYSDDKRLVDASGTIQRVIRGGSALCKVLKCRAAARDCAPENIQRSDLGFRVLRDS